MWTTILQLSSHFIAGCLCNYVSDLDPKKTRTWEKPGLVFELAFEKPGLDNRKPGLQDLKR